MPTLRRWWAVPALLLVTALLASCGFTGAQAGANTLRMAIGIPPRSGWSPASDDAMLLLRLGVAETLTDVDVNGRAHPKLATSWEQVGEREWRFTLADGVRFQSGEPLTAQAAAKSLNNVVHQAAPPRTLRDTVTGARAADTHTLVVRTSAPDPILPLRMGSANTAILAPAALGADGKVDINAGIGTGPFRIAGTNGPNSVRLRRYDEYRGKPAELARVDVRFVEDAAARMNGLRSGEFDLIDKVPVSRLDAVRSDPALRASTVDLPRTTGLHMNLERGVFADRDVRVAAERAINRHGLVDGVLRGRGSPAEHYFGPVVPWSSDERVPRADPAAARDQLMRATGGKRVPITIGTYPERPDLPAVTTVLADELERVGFDVRIVQEPADQLETKMFSGQLDALVYSRNYLVDMPDAGSYLASDFSCTGSFNLDHFCDPRIEGILDSLRRVRDPDRRGELFRRADHVLTERKAGVPLFHEQDQLARHKDVRGVPTDPLEQEMLTEEVSVR